MKRLIVATALALLFGLFMTTHVARGSAPDYPAPGFTAEPNPPSWDKGRPGITWCFVPGKGYSWFENNAIQAAGAQPALYRSVPQQPAPCPTCPTCPNGQCPVPRRF